MGVHLTDVYLIGMHLTGVYLTGMHLTGVYPWACLSMHFMGIHLIGGTTQKPVTDKI